VASIDMVRGLAMVVMALDHVRDFISNIPFEPEDINHTWGFYFLVRWVTHFCAPAFFFLAGWARICTAESIQQVRLKGICYRAACGWWCWNIR
jgi:uncharacterized membrane protein